MGLLDKLFGNDKDAKAALEFLKTFAAESKKSQPQQSAAEKKEEAKPAQPAAPAEKKPSTTPIGRSWGEDMPDEPNQFNFNGTYVEYFENIFAEEFSEYTTEKKINDKGKRITYTFRDGTKTALVLELFKSNCEAKALRRKCEAEGIPYLRYYVDYEGWWNARSYVVERTRKALKG
ncbi:MAG: hypothetical protein J6V01_08075 [Clostridia bacterium]|nr:hypothetical protein [Clostridia bacterium]